MAKEDTSDLLLFPLREKGEEADVNITAVKSTAKGLVLIIDRGDVKRRQRVGVFFFNRGAPYNDFLLFRCCEKIKNRILGLSDVDFRLV